MCKNKISKENLIPIYTKEETENKSNRFKIPNRPNGQREANNNNYQNNNNFGGFSNTNNNNIFNVIYPKILKSYLISFDFLVLIWDSLDFFLFSVSI